MEAGPTAYGLGSLGQLGGDLGGDDALDVLLQPVHDGLDVLPGHDLVQRLADLRAATGDEHTRVVLAARLGQLLDGGARVRVGLEEALLGLLLQGRLAHRHVAGGLGEGDRRGGIGDERGELEGIDLALVGDARRDADARAAGGAVAVLAFILPFPRAVQLSLYFVILVDLVLLYFLIIQLWRREFRYSGFYLAGWIIFLGSVMLHLLTIFGILPAHNVMRSAFHLSFLVQSLLFTLALGSKHRELLEEEKNTRIAMKLIEQEYRQASDIHRRLLPEKKPEIPRLGVDILYIPMGQLGGDFYTFQEQDAGSWIFLIADVQGHGLPAALDASSVKLAFQEAVSKKGEPGSILSEMNRLLALHLRNRFISAQVLRWLPEHNKMQIASAGHPYPLLYSRASGKSRELRAEGSILGLYSEANYREFEVQLAKGDYLLAYTDGLIDDPASESSYDDDMQNLMAVMESMDSDRPAAAHFARQMPRFRVSKPWSDDVTALLLTCNRA